VRSRRFAAVLDQLLDAPEASQVLLLKAGRRSRSLVGRGGRWLRRRLMQPAPGGALAAIPAAAPAQGAPGQERAGAADVPSLEEQRFVLIRIIGNDLYPRHDAGQSLQNLRFILENEPILPGCEKRWLLNRIRQPERLLELTQLLDAHGYGYDILPYEAEAFQSERWDWSVLPTPDYLASRSFLRLLSHQRQSWEIALYRHKNNYLMHNNGARNRALELGRHWADWILPWDGNCFLTAAGWQSLRLAVASQQDADYFHVPMQRVADNAQLLYPAFEADPRDEPQLLFAAGAAELFNPAFPYGRRPKVELFWRLGLRGPWDAWPDEPWDQPRRPRLTPAPACPVAGWVARLHSGVRGASAAAGQAVLSQQGRYSARNLAIKASINQALQPDDGTFTPAAFAAHWQQPCREAQQQQGHRARQLLEDWWRWWQGGGTRPPVSAEQLISAFCHVHWSSLRSAASTDGMAPSEGVALLLEQLAAVWFSEGPVGLQPRLRLLRRPLAFGRLPGTAPSASLALQLALLADLLIWSSSPDQAASGAGGPGDRANAWPERVLAWCDRLTEHLQALVDPAWLGDRVRNQQRLQLALALLQRHRGHPTASADALLRLLALHHPHGRAVHAAEADPALRDLALALAGQHGLLDPGLAQELGWSPPVCLHPPLCPLASV